MNKFQQVKNQPNLIRDSHSKAILNTDKGAAARHKAKAAKLAADAQRELERHREIDALKTEIQSLRQLVNNLVEIVGNMSKNISDIIPSNPIAWDCLAPYHPSHHPQMPPQMPASEVFIPTIWYGDPKPTETGTITCSGLVGIGDNS